MAAKTSSSSRGGIAWLYNGEAPTCTRRCPASLIGREVGKAPARSFAVPSSRGEGKGEESPRRGLRTRHRLSSGARPDTPLDDMLMEARTRPAHGRENGRGWRPGLPFVVLCPPD